MLEFISFIKNNFANIIIGIIIFFGLLVLLSILEVDFSIINSSYDNKEIDKVVTIESMI